MKRLLVLIGLLVFVTLVSAAPPQDTDTWTVETEDGVKLFGESFGPADGPGVLFIHGGPSFPPMQRPAWLARLGETHRVHLFHQRGSGRSGRPIDQLPDDEGVARELLVTTYGIKRHLADIEEVAQARFGDRTVILVGHSFGGYLATRFAASHPGRVGRLVLLAPADVLDGLLDKPVFDLIAGELPESERPGFREEMTAFLTPRDVGGTTDAELAAGTDMFGWYFMRAVGRSIPKPGTYPPMRWSGGAAVAGLMIDLADSGDARARAGSITAPTLVIHGAQDISPRAASEMYAAAITGARLVTFEDESHFFDADPRAVAAAIAEVTLDAAP